MKLRNKKTGEIIEKCPGWFAINSGEQIKQYNSLTKLNEEWEDYEEPKTVFCITDWGDIREYTTKEERFAFKQKLEIGNYFETKEEAELAVRKLKAWKRLKEAGFRFDEWEENHHNLGIIEFSFDKVENNVWDFEKDLDLLFGGEE